jgi:hypothetical protein
MKLVLLLFLAATAFAGPTIFYSKFFPGSKPEWVGVLVARDGSVEYRETKEEEPMKFSLDKADVDLIYAQAEKLGNFSRPLESGLPVAKMGEKSYRYEDGAVKSEVKFNYSQDADAQTLQDFMERIVETEQALINLERTARFDRLGVNQSLLQVQMLVERKRIVSPQQFLKMLDRVAKNDVYLNIARDRAAQLAANFRALMAPAAPVEGK